MNEIDFMGILLLAMCIGLIAIVVDSLVDRKRRCREEGEELGAAMRILERACPIVVPLVVSVSFAVAILAGAQLAEDTVVPILRSMI